MSDDEECTRCGVRQDFLGPCDECEARKVRAILGESRFTVTEHRVSPELIRKYPDLERILWRVWDTKNQRAVPFGQYADKDQAQQRADREERKAAGS